MKLNYSWSHCKKKLFFFPYFFDFVIDMVMRNILAVMFEIHSENYKFLNRFFPFKLCCRIAPVILQKTLKYLIRAFTWRKHSTNQNIICTTRFTIAHSWNNLRIYLPSILLCFQSYCHPSLEKVQQFILNWSKVFLIR